MAAALYVWLYFREECSRWGNMVRKPRVSAAVPHAVFQYVLIS